MVHDYSVCPYQKNSASEAITAVQAVNEATTFPDPPHASDVSDRKMWEMLTRATEGGRGSDRRHQPSSHVI